MIYFIFRILIITISAIVQAEDVCRTNSSNISDREILVEIKNTIAEMGQKISVDLDKRIEILSNELNTRMDNLSEDLNGRMHNLSEDLNKRIDKLSALQLSEHEFVPERVEFIKSLSNQVKFSFCNGTATSFAMATMGYVASITVAHMECSDEILTYYTACEKLDIAVSKFCPTLTKALDGSKFAALREGDPIVAYGFSNTTRSWSGLVGGPFVSTDIINPPFSGTATVHKGDIMVTGDQEPGQSGCLILNSRGAVGVGHCVEMSNRRIVSVIPFIDVIQCVNQLIKKDAVKKLADCPHIVVHPPPTLFV